MSKTALPMQVSPHCWQQLVTHSHLLQGSESIYTRDGSLRNRILQLLRTMVEAAAPDAVQLQCKPLLAVLLRMRGSIMLSATLDDRELEMVSINAHPEC